VEFIQDHIKLKHAIDIDWEHQ